MRDEEKAEGDNSTEKLLQEGELCIRTQNDLNDFLRNIDMWRLETIFLMEQCYQCDYDLSDTLTKLQC